jgi:acid phosphatase (class A)
MSSLPRTAIAAALALAAAGCAHVQSAVMPVVAELSGSIDGVAVVGGPPSADVTAAEAATVRGPWSEERVARAQADNRFDAFSALAPVMGEEFTADAYPLTDTVFDRMLTPLGAAINLAKDRYARDRPFEMDAAVRTCIEPSDGLRASGAYPSGHAAFGWAWALVLAELVPSRADAILQRGRDYGDSRVVCGLHYPSDVEAGRTIAAAALARLHADPAFRRALDEARSELAQAYAH